MTAIRTAPLVALLVLAAPALAQQAAPLPRKYAGPPTVADITPGDLMTRLYKFADDSMMGRQIGTPFNDMGTAYIESEVRRLGLQPAGDNGTYFQKVPIFTRLLDSASTLTVDGGSTLRAGIDFVATANGFARPLSSAATLFVGPTLDTTKVIPADSARGKVLVFTVGSQPTNIQAYVQSDGYRRYLAMRSAAAANVTVVGDALPPNALRSAFASTGIAFLQDSVSISLTLTRAAGETLIGAPAASWAPGTAGKRVTAAVAFKDTPKPGRNVVAILPGSDPKLKGQYVAIGAHNDHVGVRAQGPLDHDSVKAFMQVVRPQGADSDPRPATAEEAARVKAILDSLRAVNAPRPDSIYNGADDDGSGSMTVLEIAEAFALGREKPKRSILFVWHTGEELGLWGASHFTAHPTVPRDSIVGQLNMDMVGRGAATDVTGEDLEGKLLRGGNGYVQLIGSRRLSTEMGDLLETVNTEKKLGLRFDYAMDANGHPQNIYCRSDHYEYAKYGIPITFISTGGHADYHQVTDEPQYIEYPHMAQLARFVYESAMRIANLDHRLVVDKPKPDPKGSCVQ